jgi:SAM-dependent methyltransferase
MAAPDKELSRIARYYEERVARHGHSPLACDYGHPASQLAKFAALAGVCDHAGRSVLDVGCGFGDYGQFLQARYPGCRYTGIDITGNMIERGKSAYPQLDLRVGNLFDHGFAPGQYDIVSANGIFYLLGERAESLMMEAIAILFSLASRAVAFNSLSTWAPDRDPAEFHADPLRVADHCRRLTPWVVMRHDYHPRDFSIYLYKNQNAG